MRGGMKLYAVVLLMVILPFFTVFDYASADMEEDLREIKQALKEIKKDVKELKQTFNSLLSRTKKPQKTTAATTIDDDPVMGSPDAKVTLVEFSDYQCPYCSRFYRSTYPVIKDEFVKTGKLLYVFRDYPLPFHKKAQKAHEAANCAGEQNKYWKMHDRIFNNQQTMDVEDLRKHAETLALDTTVFNTCLNSGKHAQEINKDIEAGKTAGVQGTSSFILGMTNNNGQVKGLFISGARPTEYFRKEINKMLLQANK